MAAPMQLPMSGAGVSQFPSQPQPPAQQPQQSQHGQSSEADPILVFKDLIPRLKASLVNVMRVSGKVFKENSQADNLRPGEESAERLDHNLEHFYALCDQVEMNLKLALECVQQNSESSKYTPVPVSSVNKADHGATEQQSFHQYLSLVQTQISCAKEIHDAFLDCSKKITERPLPAGLQQQQQQLLQQQQAAQHQAAQQQAAQQQAAQQQAAQQQVVQQQQQTQQLTQAAAQQLSQQQQQQQQQTQQQGQSQQFVAFQS